MTEIGTVSCMFGIKVSLNVFQIVRGEVCSSIQYYTRILWELLCKYPRCGDPS